MEYNTMLYKVFRYVKASNSWVFVRTFQSFTEASRFCNEQTGAYVIQGEESHD